MDAAAASVDRDDGGELRDLVWLSPGRQVAQRVATDDQAQFSVRPLSMDLSSCLDSP